MPDPSLLERALAAFARRFPGGPPRLFRAPGRVNLIGEHTDYNDGFVLPVAIDRQVMVAARRREDRRVRLYALSFDQETEFNLDAIAPDAAVPWSNYGRGVGLVLRQEGYRLPGMDAAIAGDVPIGAGLSSSAALEVAVGYAMLRLAGLEVEGTALAKAAQRAENEFVGMRCGIMDQLIACLGQAEHALLIDCRSLGHRTLPLPADAAIVVVDSGVRRGLKDSEYNSRRAECEAAARHFGVPALRDVDEATFRSRAPELPESTRRRARHVVTENARTLAAALALETSSLHTFGRLMYASHASLRDDFEVSTPELNALVEIAAGVPGVYGARLTGAGFGGCVVALAQRVAAPALVAAIEAQYPARSGRRATVYICRASTGTSEIT
ncbi:MAG: galactokinase [Chloroflexi bacterium]|nr:galactokinase [Chloroflexota bacterium]